MKKFFNVLIALILLLVTIPTGAFADIQVNTINSQYVTSSTTNGGKVYYVAGTGLYVYNEATNTNTKLNSNSLSFLSAVQTTNGDKVFYSNGSDGSSLYMYEQATNTNRKINSFGSDYISAVETNTGTKIYYRNRSNNNLYEYDQATSTERKLNTISANSMSAVSTGTGAKAFYLSGADLYVYDSATQTNTRLLQAKAVAISAINTSTGIKVYYKGYPDNFLYEYDETTKVSTKLNSFNSNFIAPVEFNNSMKVYYQNANDNNYLYEYDKATNTNNKVSSNSSQFITPIVTNGDIHVFYSNSSQNYNIYRYDYHTLKIEELVNVVETHGTTWVNLDWKNPINQDLQKIIIYKDGVKINTIDVPNTQYKVISLAPNTEYTFKLTTWYGQNLESPGTTIKVTTNKLEEITNLTNSVVEDSIRLNWENPTFNEFDHVQIYKDGQMAVNNFTNNTYNFTGLQFDTEYEFVVKTVDKFGNVSIGKTIKAKTGSYVPPEVKKPEVSTINVIAEANKVELSWVLPQSTWFDHVNIYRDTVTTASLMDKIINFFVGEKVSAATKLFETNGTYFKDFSVTPNTKYDYTVSTTNTLNQESVGKTLRVMTKQVSKPVVDNPIAKEKKDDYDITWDNPTSGKIRILVNGNIYAEVNANLKQFTLPNSSVVKDMSGNPLIKIQAVTDTGIEGDIQKVQVNSSLMQTMVNVFTAQDIISSSFGLIVLLAPFVLVGLSMALFKPFRNMIMNLFKRNKQKGVNQ